MKEEKGVVVENRNIGGNFFLLKIEAPYISKMSIPGNFVMTAVSGSSDPLLKRPLGIFDAKSPHIYLYYEIVGRGTKLLSGKRESDFLDLVGPLGNGFPELSGKNILMIAGGRGIAPLFFAMKKYSINNKISVVYGASTKNALNFTEEIQSLKPSNSFFYTEDGSAFKEGLVTKEIDKIIEDTEADTIFSCGPHGMLRSLADISHRSGIKNFSSLEADMGCGFGICYSCVVRTVGGGYKKVCTDGPVFDSKEIDWEALK